MSSYDAAACAAIRAISGVDKRIAFLRKCLEQEIESKKAQSMERFRHQMRQAAIMELEEALSAVSAGTTPYYLSMLHKDPLPADLLVTTSSVADPWHWSMWNAAADGLCAKVCVDEPGH
jgi:hypothetical protein